MAKRFSKPSINWAEFIKLVPLEDKGKFLGFKGKSDGYLRRVLANPEKPPTIDWEAYNKSVPVEGLVDKLKSAYENFEVPYPTDTLSSKVDEQWASLQTEIKAFCAEKQQAIDAASKELSRLNALPSFDEMNMEMFYDMHPELALDPVKRPSFWPHTPDEQLDYVSPEQAAQKEH